MCEDYGILCMEWLWKCCGLIMEYLFGHAAMVSYGKQEVYDEGVYGQWVYGQEIYGEGVCYIK